MRYVTSEMELYSSERAERETEYRKMSQRAANIISRIDHNDVLLRDKLETRRKLQKELCEIECPSEAYLFDSPDENRKVVDLGKIIEDQNRLFHDFMNSNPRNVRFFRKSIFFYNYCRMKHSLNSKLASSQTTRI